MSSIVFWMARFHAACAERAALVDVLEN